jgi:cephalosporin hydroxylase
MQGRKCVVEFVVDMQILDRTAKKMGDISYIEGFSGDIETIERIDE